MNLLRIRTHHLVEQIPDEDMQKVWELIEALHCDSYIMKAMTQVKSSQQPWDILTHDEAIRLLMFL